MTLALLVCLWRALESRVHRYLHDSRPLSIPLESSVQSWRADFITICVTIALFAYLWGVLESRFYSYLTFI